MAAQDTADAGHVAAAADGAGHDLENGAEQRRKTGRMVRAGYQFQLSIHCKTAIIARDSDQTAPAPKSQGECSTCKEDGKYRCPGCQAVSCRCAYVDGNAVQLLRLACVDGTNCHRRLSNFEASHSQLLHSLRARDAVLDAAAAVGPPGYSAARCPDLSFLA